MINHRISREQMLLEMAFIASKRGTCGRLSVGAIIARESRPISLGYVGAPAGEPHCWEAKCDLSKPCTRTHHAEANAIHHAHTHGIGIVGATMYSTDSPCLQCADMIVQAKISRVVYSREYRVKDGLLYLRKYGVKVEQVIIPELCAHTFEPRLIGNGPHWVGVCKNCGTEASAA